MNAGAKIGLGVAGGYVLGRRRKARLALGLGAYLLGKRMNLSPAQLALSGTQALKGMPEFAELSDALRGELMTAGRRAAAAAMTQRLGSLADNLSERTDALERGGKETGQAAGKAAGKAAGSSRKKANRVIDLTAAESDDAAYPDEPEESGRGRSGNRETARARGRSTRRRRGGADADDEESDYAGEPEDVDDELDEDEYDDEPEDVDDELDDDEYDDEEPEDVEDEYDEDEYDDEEPEDVEDEYDDEGAEDEEADQMDDRRSPARASGRSRRRQPARR